MTIQNIIQDNPQFTDEQVLAAFQQTAVLRQRTMSASVQRLMMQSVGLYDWFMESNATGLRALARDEMLMGGEFNWMIGHPLYLGDKLASLKAESPENAAALDTLQSLCESYCNEETFPNENATLSQVKAIRYPATYQLCTHLEGAQDWIVSTSQRNDLMVFTIDAAEPVNALQIKLKWRENGEATWKTQAGVIRLQGGEGLYTDTIRRPAGLSAARHFQCEYLAEHAQQINSVAVNVGQ